MNQDFCYSLGYFLLKLLSDKCFSVLFCCNVRNVEIDESNTLQLTVCHPGARAWGAPVVQMCPSQALYHQRGV